MAMYPQYFGDYQRGRNHVNNDQQTNNDHHYDKGNAVPAFQPIYQYYVCSPCSSYGLAAQQLAGARVQTVTFPDSQRGAAFEPMADGRRGTIVRPARNINQPARRGSFVMPGPLQPVAQERAPFPIASEGGSVLQAKNRTFKGPPGVAPAKQMEGVPRGILVKPHQKIEKPKRTVTFDLPESHGGHPQARGINVKSTARAAETTPQIPMHTKCGSRAVLQERNARLKSGRFKGSPGLAPPKPREGALRGILVKPDQKIGKPKRRVTFDLPQRDGLGSKPKGTTVTSTAPYEEAPQMQMHPICGLGLQLEQEAGAWLNNGRFTGPLRVASTKPKEGSPRGILVKRPRKIQKHKRRVTFDLPDPDCGHSRQRGTQVALLQKDAVTVPPVQTLAKGGIGAGQERGRCAMPSAAMAPQQQNVYLHTKPPLLEHKVPRLGGLANSRGGIPHWNQSTCATNMPQGSTTLTAPYLSVASSAQNRHIWMPPTGPLARFGSRVPLVTTVAPNAAAEAVRYKRVPEFGRNLQRRPVVAQYQNLLPAYTGPVGRSNGLQCPQNYGAFPAGLSGTERMRAAASPFAQSAVQPPWWPY